MYKLKSTFPLALLIIISAALGGCAKTLSQVKWHDEPVHAQPEQGKALVYFMREKKAIAGGTEARMYDGNEKIGALPNGTYFFYQADPGQHTFTSALSIKDSVTLSLEEGKTYYIRANAKLTLLGMPAEMEVIPASVGTETVKELTYVTLRDIFK